MSPALWFCSAELSRSGCQPQTYMNAQTHSSSHDNACSTLTGPQTWWLMFQRGPHVCISCGSITETKNLSLTAFAITAAADCKTVKTRQKKCCSAFCVFNLLKKKKTSLERLFYSVCSWYESSKYSESALGKNLLCFLDELITVIKPGQEGDESPLPCEDSSILLQVIYI